MYTPGAMQQWRGGSGGGGWCVGDGGGAQGKQTLLREVDNQTLILALKTADEVVRTKIMGNLSKRAAEMLAEDMEVMGPTKLSDVEKAQTTVTQLALRLEAEGKLVISRPGSDDELV